MKKLISLGLASAMAVTLLAGCGGNKTTQTEAPNNTADAAESQTSTGNLANLNVCIGSEPQTIDPALNSSVDGAMMINTMYEGLFKWVDSHNAVEGVDTCNQAALAPGQVASTQVMTNDDGTVTYTFHLRDNIKWSDGKDVTANDYVYSWRRLANPKTAADYCYMIDMVKGYAEVNEQGADPSTLAVEAPDDKTFVVTLTYDCPYFTEVCAFPATFPVREDMVTANPDGWTYDASTYLSNGAYRLKAWDHNAQIVVEKNPNYVGQYGEEKVGPDTVTFKLMDNVNAKLTAFKAGDLDFIDDVPVDEITSLLNSGDLNIVPYVGTYFACFNTEEAPFNDARVRKAFAMTIDAKYIVENVTRSGQVPATGFVPAGVNDADEDGADFRTTGGEYWSSATSEQYQKNVEEAKKLMAEAGYPNGEGFPTVTYLYNTSDNHKKIGEALQQQWKAALGVDIKLENQDWAVFQQNRNQGNFQICRHGWIADYNDPLTFLDMWMTGGGNNDAQYSNAEYDALLKEAKASSDPAVRMKAMHDAEDILIGQDAAVAPIYFYTQKYMLSDKVQGLYFTPLGYFFFDEMTQK